MKQTIQITILDNGYLLEYSTGSAPVRKMAFESIDILLETLGDIFNAEITVKDTGKNTGKVCAQISHTCEGLNDCPDLCGNCRHLK